MNFFLASGNSHKAKEFSELFDSEYLQILPSPEKVEVVEDGTSYFENSFLKAKGYFEKLEAPVVADDSGLNVTSFPDQLGIHSARFGGEGLTDKDRALALLELFEQRPNLDRSAYFTCVLCFYFSENEYFFFEGRMKGAIAKSYIGKGGFGYDPVFIPEGFHEGQTVATLEDWKKLSSHRAKACHEAQLFFQERNCQI